jgi:hypothetical protein
VLSHGSNPYNPFFYETGTHKPTVVGGGDTPRFAFRGVSRGTYTLNDLFDRGQQANEKHLGFETGRQGLRPRLSKSWRTDVQEDATDTPVRMAIPSGKVGHGVGYFHVVNGSGPWVSFASEFESAAVFGADGYVALVDGRRLNAVNVSQMVRDPAFQQDELTSLGGVGGQDVLVVALVDGDMRPQRLDIHPDLLAAAKRGNILAKERIRESLAHLQRKVSRARSAEQLTQNKSQKQGQVGPRCKPPRQGAGVRQPVPSTPSDVSSS